MNAVISGAAGLALVLEGTQGFAIRMDAPDETLAVDPAHGLRCFGDAQDLMFVEGLTREQVIERLEQACNDAQALDVALIALDAELSDDCRMEAARELNELLASDETRTWLDHVFRARPFPPESDVAGALRCSTAAGAQSTYVFFETLRVLQPFIGNVWAAWDSIPASVIPVAQRRPWTAVLVREGIFDELVQAVAAGGHLPQTFEAASLRVANKLPGWNDTRRAWQDQVWLHVRGGKTRLPLESVYQAKDEIVQAMERNAWADAREKVAELVSEEIAGNDVEGAIKSLCSLAKRAQDVGFLEFQRELTTEAVNIGPFSVRAWAQHGKALLDAGDMAGALYAYDRALALERNVIVKTGRAEVLKAQGDYAQALHAYESTITQHPDNVVAKTGRAEVLKAQGDYARALHAYESTIAQHPDNVVAKTGRAEVLKVQGDYAQALHAYESTIAHHPNDVVAKNGRAEVLKAQGDYARALHAYESTIAQHPDNVVAKTGRVGVLVAMRKYDEALASLSVDAPHTHGDWIGYHIRGMIYLRTGKLDDARQIFDEGLRATTMPVDRDYFRNALAATLLRYRQYDAARLLLDEVKTPELQPHANMLRTHAFGALGDVAHASEAYLRLPEKGSILLLDIREELRRRFIDHLPVNWQEDELIDREVEFLMAA